MAFYNFLKASFDSIQWQEQAPSAGVIGDYPDAVYPDEWMERRWPNMKLTEPGET